jgi:hypothetical protein
MRYQLSYRRTGTSIGGGPGGIYEMTWNPLAGPMDTRCYTNIEEIDTRIGTYDYIFMVRSFDDEGNVDTTPDTIRYVGNFPPVIDEIEIGYDSAPFNGRLDFVPFSGDTIYLGIGRAYQFRPDTATVYDVTFDPSEYLYTYFFMIILRGSGRDDRRDPPGSGIKSWRYTMQGSEDHEFSDEGEWIADDPLNEYEQEVHFQIEVPFDTFYQRPDYSIVDDPPGFLGAQELIVMGADIHPDDEFSEHTGTIPPRCIPECPCSLISPGRLITTIRKPFPHARCDRHARNIYIKLVR